MPVITEYRGLSKIIVTYTAWKRPEAIFTFPTNGLEDSRAYNKGFTQTTVVGAVGVIYRDFACPSPRSGWMVVYTTDPCNLYRQGYKATFALLDSGSDTMVSIRRTLGNISESFPGYFLPPQTATFTKTANTQDFEYDQFSNSVNFYKRTIGSTTRTFIGGINLGDFTPNPQAWSYSQCPPNTCLVGCGSNICCYNSQGVSVFNYSN